MDDYFKNIILTATRADNLYEINKLQDLWSGYGVINRYGLEGSELETIIVKHIKIPSGKNHPRGWDSDLSHQRKLKSYEIEASWYRHWSSHCNHRCRVPKCLALEKKKSEILIVLQDLNTVGFGVRREYVSLQEIKVCLKWLAHFHATFIKETPNHLWETGTYWHLETRPDEWKALKDKALKGAAQLIDHKLKNSPFQTFVHGDAKLANFCFSEDRKRVAAVDFQYVGGGPGVKDVAYFIGSCLDEDKCEKFETELLDYYFSVLQDVLRARDKDVDIEALLKDWRALYPVAWTDFHRFIKGWSPGHWKINSYSERLAREVLENL